MPVVVRALGTIKEALKRDLKAIPGDHKAQKVQKIALIGTTQIL